MSNRYSDEEVDIALLLQNRIAWRALDFLGTLPDDAEPELQIPFLVVENGGVRALGKRVIEIVKEYEDDELPGRLERLELKRQFGVGVLALLGDDRLTSLALMDNDAGVALEVLGELRRGPAGIYIDESIIFEPNTEA